MYRFRVLRAYSFRCRVDGFRVSGLGFGGFSLGVRVRVDGFEVSGLMFRVFSLGFRV